MRFGACFLSVTDRFDAVGPSFFTAPESLSSPSTGFGDGGTRGRGFAGPVERYDLVQARQHAPLCEARYLYVFGVCLLWAAHFDMAFVHVRSRKCNTHTRSR